ncbi:hypothetical protein KTR10_00655 [Candidatus Kaiserbacteria bacterium]|nr:hypothetical protein [Candidatus Kaiserbacteria bacterium]
MNKRSLKFTAVVIALFSIVGLSIAHVAETAGKTVTYWAQLEEYRDVQVLDMKNAYLLIQEEAPWLEGALTGFYDRDQKKMVEICIPAQKVADCYKKNELGFWQPYERSLELIAIEKQLTDALVATVKPENIVE